MADASGCVIRPMGADDLTCMLAWRNHPDVRRYMITQHEISEEEHELWFARTSLDASRRLLIVEQDREPIGFVQFSEAFTGGVSDWGFYAVPGSSKGTGTKLAVTALSYAFETLKVHKVCGQALDFNESSISFHLALGFKQEGVLRSQQLISDRYHDLVCFGLLNHEWATSTV